MRKNRVISLLISISLICASVLPVMAADNAYIVSAKSQPIYLALGDSLGAGCRVPVAVTGGMIPLPAKQKTFEDYRTIAPGGSKDDMYLNPAYKKMMNHWNLNAVPYTYVSKFANFLDASSASKNGTHPGMRAKDYCYALGLIDKSAYQNDVWGEMNFKDCQLQQIKNSVKGYKTGIKNADIITVQLGDNDFTAFIYNNLDTASDFVMNLEKTMTPDELKLFKGLIAQAKDLISSTTTKGKISSLLKILNTICTIKKQSPTYQKVEKYLNESIAQSTEDIAYYWDMLMKYINENKKDNAIVIATTVPDPLKDIDKILEALGGKLPGVDIDIDAASVVKIVGLFLDPLLDGINSSIIGSASKFQYKLVNIDNVTLNSIVNNESDGFDGIELGEKVFYVVHPNHAEQNKIYQAIKKAYISEMSKQGVHIVDDGSKDKICEHNNVYIEDASKATYLKKGYTGDTLCKDCGLVLNYGKTIKKLAVNNTTITKLTSGNKSFAVKWETSDKVNGYQIQYSTSSTFKKNNKSATIANKTTSGKVVKNLKKAKKYYVRVRAYKNVKNSAGKVVKAYSKWSDKKSVKTK